jgi:acyl-CoA thioesterase-2
MPQVPAPEGLPSTIELLRRYADRIPERVRDKFLGDKPIDMRPVEPMDPFAPRPLEPIQYIWFKANGELPEDPQVHRHLLAYASDFNLISTAMRPHGHSVLQPDLQVASLDHALWVHGGLHMDDWLLYAMESPWSGNARGLAHGRIFTRDGRLVASVAQEGLIRQRTPGR